MKKCSGCKAGAIYFRANEGRHYCKKCFTRNIEKRVKTTISKFNLIEPNDRIVVALSGGKDSSNMLYVLNKIFKNNSKIKLIAITIDEGIKGYRDESIKGAKTFCKQLGVEHYLLSFEERFGTNLDKIAKKTGKDGMCSICGVLRRYLLNEKARELKASKVATGHNLDDECQSILMNLIKGDLLRLARSGPNPKIKDHSKFVQRIKPLIMIPERESALCALVNEIPAYFSECPYAVFNSLRSETQNFLNRLENKSSGVKYSLLRSAERLSPFLKDVFRKDEIRICKKCGEPTSGNICKTCLMIDKILS
jgi:uncharacterized protein (TIGR00269 family)